MEDKTMKSLVVIGRRWFQKTYGNTYHTASIVVDGKLMHRTEKEYGYGDQYVQTAERWLVENKLIPPPEKYSNGSIQPLWQHLDNLGITFHREVVDVTREKDL